MRKIIVRVSAVLLIMAMVFPLASCRGVNLSRTISAPELVRLIVSAVNDKNLVADSYAGIPEKQTGGVSFTSFTQYIDIIRGMTRQGGISQVSSFRMLSEQETLTVSNGREGCGCAELLFDTEKEVPVYVVFAYGENGQAELNGDWITGVISIYNYAQHYFTMLDTRNTEGVFTILRPGFSEDVYTDGAVYAKAQALSDFYFAKVKSLVSTYEITSIDPETLEYSIPRTLDQSNRGYCLHNVVFTANGSGSFDISDNMYYDTDPGLGYLTDGSGVKLIRVGQSYTSAAVFASLGNPLNVSVNSVVLDVVTDNNGNEHEIHKILVNYHRLLLVFHGYETGDGNWSGTCVKFIMRSDCDLFVGNGISTDDTLSEVLEIYPYLDEYGFDLVIENASGDDQEIVIDLNGENIVDQITVSVV